MSKTVFVTGGAGYVGSHCCKAFAAAGWNAPYLPPYSLGYVSLIGFALIGTTPDTVFVPRIGFVMDGA